ncbi:MAG: D-alanyl-D-alanine carboxypeptidase/D-alanyl-D-alanine-endopeptidase [Tannerella sp.]|jgi:D-alanyl-D-alanine carboxypeptidase/D-alanyl-D-alanine-endopeptidase (penicillin-binding protein 4)|nr:D-alanyl-D-alanine carboxypeptidase/D-alanyl-D-alanine-endopeptidase [Tannerella sp.]
MKNLLILFFNICVVFQLFAQNHPAITRFVGTEYLRGASVSLMVREVGSGKAVYSYDADREVIPASVLKTVTTATAIELLGADYCYQTHLMYDGTVEDSILKGNIHIIGSGDPSLGSEELKNNCYAFINEWVTAIKNAGIKFVTGAVISDAGIFDTEGVSMKWLREDLGTNYGQGCYGLNVFDNRFALFMNTYFHDSKPVIDCTQPEMYGMTFRNYLKTGDKDSCYIVGAPYSDERWLYGVVPANRTDYKLGGDIPDPPLYLAKLLTETLKQQGIIIAQEPTDRRLLAQQGVVYPQEQQRQPLAVTTSPPLSQLARITNNVSSNLYADAFVKTLGLRCNEPLSSFGKGVRVVHDFWQSKGLDTSPLWMSDGSGLAPTDKITASLLSKILCLMADNKAFVESLPVAGEEGTVKSVLKDSSLHGKARLKSGSMSRVRSYAGYVYKNDKTYAITVITNNFNCRQAQIKTEIEQLLLGLF